MGLEATCWQQYLLFAVALILASVVMYDASGVRLQAGRQAETVAGTSGAHLYSGAGCFQGIVTAVVVYLVIIRFT